MSKKIDWLDNFAEKFAKNVKMSKTAGKISKEDIIVDRDDIGNAKIGEVINYNGKLYKVADLEYEDEKGPGAILEETEETPFGEVSVKDPMSVSMGAPSEKFEDGQKSQEYARTNPGDVYHYEVPETFEQAAVATEQQIAKEDSIDRTSVSGHYSNPTEGNDIITETPVDEVINEVPVETEIKTEVPVETEIKTEVPVETESETEVPESEAINDESEVSEVSEEDEKDPIIGKRYNRILRRIMASK